MPAISAAAGPPVLFITMPWATPVHPSLGLGLLSAILAQEGIASRCLYGNLLLPRPKQPTVCGLDDPGGYDDRSAGMAFVPHLYPQVSAERIAQVLADRHRRVLSRDGQLPVGAALDEGGELHQALLAQAREDVAAAGTCLESCLAHVEESGADLIGFSLTFETQLVASLALARRIKERWPDRRVLFGGAACSSTQGVATLRSFPWIDVVCLGEGDPIITGLVRALRGQGDLAGLPGLAYREAGEVHLTPRAEPMAALDWLPTPDYTAYLSQKAQSEWAGTNTTLLFETSRGCWWGEKHLCSFCGLNAESLVYRSKSPARVLAELREITGHGVAGLQAVDNIFDTRYFAELVPALIELQARERRVSMFFEIKSNLKLWQLFQLSLAGFNALQPGIESFSDHILKLMDKGATAFQQITFIKWAQQVGIGPAYNILLRNPGETVDDYREMTALLPFLHHLQPPNGVANMQLERFSPYFLRPQDFGIRNVRPKPHYRDMFPDPGVDLDALVYQFDFDHDELDAPALRAARLEFMGGLAEWQRRYQPHRLVYFARGDEVLVLDRREDGKPRQHRLRDLEASLFHYLDRGRGFAQIAAHAAGTGAERLRGCLDGLVARRLVIHDPRKDAYLAVPVRVYPDMEEFHAHYQAEYARAHAPERPARRGRLPVAGQADARQET